MNYFFRKYTLLCKGLGSRIKDNCLLVGHGPVGRMPSEEVFLTDPSSYLREFLRKPRKTKNGLNLDGGLNLAPPVCKF